MGSVVMRHCSCSMTHCAITSRRVGTWEGLPLSLVASSANGRQGYVDGRVRDDRRRAASNRAQQMREWDERMEDVARLELDREFGFAQ
ncbi:hypothetical protein AB1Y20_003541 [Prymnesium parvum]|uniref:Uncharacterized protein n=1 Tax=Prymnesium parvum TaxID=97485 RepID=A0AB34J800_PRYPA